MPFSKGLKEFKEPYLIELAAKLLDKAFMKCLADDSLTILIQKVLISIYYLTSYLLYILVI